MALARALAADVGAILLDEPFAALDATAAADLRGVLRRRLRGRTALLITHDPVDVATLADHVIVIEDGRIAAAGAPADLLTAPATRFLAGFAGLVTVRGRARLLDDDTIAVTAPSGTTIVGVDGGGVDGGGVDGGGVDAAAPVARPIAEGAEAVALFSPSAVTLGHVDGERPETSARNVIDCAVRAIRHQGAAVRVELGVDGGDAVLVAEISAQSLAALRLAEGAPVRATIKAMQVQVLPVAE